jgi:hypothetical protein
MPQIPDGELDHIFRVTKSLSNSLLRGVEAGGTNIIIANGVAAGQKAQHFMAHIIPRKEKDGVEFVLPQKTLNDNQIEEVGNKIINTLNSLGVQTGVEVSEVTPGNEGPGIEPAVEGDDDSNLDDVSKLLGV